MESSLYHDSAEKHVTGRSVFIEDLPVDGRLLHGRVFYSSVAHARIKSIDLTKALLSKGVKSILTYKDIPGKNQLGPVVQDELCLAINEVTFCGQAIALVAADSDEAAFEAVKKIVVEFEPLPSITDLETAMREGSMIDVPRKIQRGNPEKTLKTAPYFLTGTLGTGAQEHWYLETQTSLAIPGEGKEMKVLASTQHPSETQTIVAEVLGIAKNEVEVEVRRIGGAFGGKETQGNHVAAWAALLANATKRPVLIHLFRDDDQVMTGKRHRFLSNYEIGFDNEGKILAYKVVLNADAGAAADLSMAILMRAMLHAENAYYIPNISITGKAWKTNLPSNTAFRGFGGPQGMAVIEDAIDRIARLLGKDSAEIRFINFYRPENEQTPYGQEIINNHLQLIFERLMTSSSYYLRRKEINAFNLENKFHKKGLAITPVKFGISFTTAFLNQAGALVHIYTDGSVLVNHGGTEMGQGLHTKILSIASAEFGLSPDKIKVNTTNTSYVPNTSATAASSGSDMNGMAVKNAIETLKERLAPVIMDEFSKLFSGVPTQLENLHYLNNEIIDTLNPERVIPFKEVVNLAYLKQVSLSSTGYYSTPGIYFDKEKGQGQPFYYYAFGMAVSEVMIDTLTGKHKLLRTDILQDIGDSINTEIDRGQIEGGFMQGVGWCTTEEIKWDNEGRLLTHSPDTYKIPTITDIPTEFNVEILENVPNPGTIRKSKAIGEPPFMLAFSVWLAIKDAISAVGDHKSEPEFSLPATGEVILLSVEKLKGHL